MSHTTAPTVGEAIVRILEAVGIDTCFGMPGGQTLPFYKAARARGLRHVLIHDERNGACAADAYAKVSGKVGLCDATVGPGVTNLVSGLAESYASSVPVIALIADIDTRKEHLRERSVTMQSMNQRAMLEPMVKWYGRVQTPDMLVDTVDHALRVATGGRPGPVVLEVPEEIMPMSVDNLDLSRFSPDSARWPRHRSAAPQSAIDRAVALLAEAKRPIVLAGGGAMASGAYDEVARLAEEFGLPVVTTINGKGIIDEGHSRARGVVGLFGDVAGSCALEEADVVLALGTKFTLFNTFSWKLPSSQHRVIHIDVDAEELGRTGPVALGIVADVREAAQQLLQGLAKAELRVDWTPRQDLPAQPGTAADDPHVAPEKVVAAINDSFDDKAIVVSDASLSSGWCAANFRVRRPGRRMLAPRGIGGLGWACGGALGAAMAATEGERIVVVAGDGAASYWLGEIETAVRLKLPITFIVLNNSSLGWVVQIELNDNYNGVSRFASTNFAAIGEALGAQSARTQTLEETRAALDKAAASDGPFVLDVLSSEAACATVNYDLIEPDAAKGQGAYGIS